MRARILSSSSHQNTLLARIDSPPNLHFTHTSSSTLDLTTTQLPLQTKHITHNHNHV
jgi:hypothetical protein